MKTCLESIIDLKELKTLTTNHFGLHFIDISSEKLQDKFFSNFDPNECHKYITRIKTSHEEAILFTIAQYMRKLKEMKTKEMKNNELLDIKLVINEDLIKHIKKVINFEYNDKLIINLLNKIFNTVDTLDKNNEIDNNYSENEFDSSENEFDYDDYDDYDDNYDENDYYDEKKNN